MITDQSQGYSATLQVEAPKDIKGVNKLLQPGLDRPSVGANSSPTPSPRPSSRNPSPRPSPRGGQPPLPHSPGQPPVAPAVKPTEDTAYGLDKELKEKQMAKYDVGLEGEVTTWIEKVTGETRGDQSMHEWLKSGQVLCKLVNAVKAGKIPKVNTMSAPFKQMENITYFMNAARDLGVPEASMFGTPDLYEEKNMGSVVNCIYTFGGAIQVSVPEFKGPKLGIALTDHVGADKKRGGGLLTDASAGFSKTMEVKRPSCGGR